MSWQGRFPTFIESLIIPPPGHDIKYNHGEVQKTRSFETYCSSSVLITFIVGLDAKEANREKVALMQITFFIVPQCNLQSLTIAKWDGCWVRGERWRKGIKLSKMRTGTHHTEIEECLGQSKVDAPFGAWPVPIALAQSPRGTICVAPHLRTVLWPNRASSDDPRMSLPTMKIEVETFNEILQHNPWHSTLRKISFSRHCPSFYIR